MAAKYAIPQVKLEIKPRELEFITAKDIRDLIKYVHRSQTFQKKEAMKREGRDLLEHFTFIAFIIGKQKAAEEAGFEYWGMEPNDFPLLEEIRSEFYRDFNQLVDDIAAEKDLDDVKVAKYLRRSDLIAQMAVWKAFNFGKVALWDDEIFKRRTFIPVRREKLTEQRYKYEGKFMFHSEADDLVCDFCGPLSGKLADDPYDLEVPPLHPNCRCVIIGIPTVKVYDKQVRFAKKFEEEEE